VFLLHPLDVRALTLEHRDELLAEAVVAIRDELDRQHPWRLDALCREPRYESARFFPQRGASTEPATSVCGRCRVRDECVAFATAGGAMQRDGIWGGLSARARKRRADCK
jgi:WhiB family redox-sensing transcriptional regulator